MEVAKYLCHIPTCVRISISCRRLVERTSSCTSTANSGRSWRHPLRRLTIPFRL